ncbi:Jerky like protein-like [Dictyocoela muelleri]|nr:Jerky like protein-like [Dictyocoela muelleri]
MKKNLQERKKIATEIKDKNYTVKDIMKIYNITKSVAETIRKNAGELIKISTRDSTLDSKYNVTKVNTKHADIDSYIMHKIEILRSKKIPITRITILNLAKEYFKSIHSQFKKVSLCFVNTFVKRQGLSFISLHGNSASADTFLIEDFKERLNRELEDYEIHKIFNIDETSLYIRTGFNKSYVLDKKNR